MQSAPAEIPSSGDGPADARAAWLQRPDKVREPGLTDSVVLVSAPALAVCAIDGQIRDVDCSRFTTAHGYYDQDRRILSRSELTIDGEWPEYSRHRVLNATSSKHVSYARTRDDPTPSAEILVVRVHRAGVGEKITVSNVGSRDRSLTIVLHVAADLADISEVRRGQPGHRGRLYVGRDNLRWSSTDDETVVTLDLSRTAMSIERVGAEGAELRWTVELPARDKWELELLVATAEAPQAEHAVQAAKTPVSFVRPEPTGDERLDQVVSHGIDDLQALLLAPAEAPSQMFAAAGAPWYLTLFGRDSLWTARLMLPVDPHGDLAFGTLHALAALQGLKDDPETDEQPGRILHELRRSHTTHQQGEVLPPVYYGSIDSTPLFVLLLVDAYRATGDRERTLELMPAARAAIEWMRSQAEAVDARGFITYSATHTGGLYNLGWKDSYDAIMDSEGRRAKGSIALCEVQAYAYEAARGFAELLRELLGDDAKKQAWDLDEWAEGLKQRFMSEFEVTESGTGTYFAIALDSALEGDDKTVRGLASNMGHLLGSGMLSSEQAAQVAGHLASEQLCSGWGLRTRGSEHGCYSPMSYHGGAVWAHDTAIAIRGLSQAARRAHDGGDDASARVCADAGLELAEGLLAAAKTFDYRLPELFSGGTREPGDVAPLPFPTSCKPQAWSAAAGVAVWQAIGQLKLLSSEFAGDAAHADEPPSE